MAAIMALEALKRPCVVDLYTDSPVCAPGHHGLDPRLEAQGLEDRRQEASQERRSLAAARRRRGASHEVQWHWVRGHAGHTENERVDGLAREGMAPFMRRNSGANPSA